MRYLSLFEVPEMDNTRAVANHNVNSPFQQGRAPFQLVQIGTGLGQILKIGGSSVVETYSGQRNYVLITHTLSCLSYQVSPAEDGPLMEGKSQNQLGHD